MVLKIWFKESTENFLSRAVHQIFANSFGNRSKYVDQTRSEVRQNQNDVHKETKLMQKTGQYFKPFWRYLGKNAPKSTKIYGWSKVGKFKLNFSQGGGAETMIPLS